MFTGVVSVLKTGKARDPFLGACGCNIWYSAATLDVDLEYVHIPGKQNQTADLIPRWTGSLHDTNKLYSLISSPIWLSANIGCLEINNHL